MDPRQHRQPRGVAAQGRARLLPALERSREKFNLIFSLGLSATCHGHTRPHTQLPLVQAQALAHVASGHMCGTLRHGRSGQVSHSKPADPPILHPAHTHSVPPSLSLQAAGIRPTLSLSQQHDKPDACTE